MLGSRKRKMDPGSGDYCFKIYLIMEAPSCTENNIPGLEHFDLRSLVDRDLNDALLHIFQLLVKLYKLQRNFIKSAGSFIH